MFRPAFLAVGLVSLVATPLWAQPAGDQEVKDLALVLTVAYENLGREHNADAVRKLLGTTPESLQGTPTRLLQSITAEADSKTAILGKPVPKPDNLFRLAVLHPSESKVVFVCDKGVIVIQDLAEPDAKPVKLVTSRAKPLAYGAFSGDGKFFAVGDSEGGIMIWETKTWKETKIITKGTGVMRTVGLDKTGDNVIADTDDGPILWNVAANKEIGVVGDRLVFGASFCFSNDQQHFATGGDASVRYP